MKLSVIIPTCDRADRLKECLRRIEGADEIIVADDSQTTKTRELIYRDYKNTTWVQGPRKGPAANRNRGAHASSGDWFVFIDDDCLPAQNWLSEIRNATTGYDVVEGKTICPDKTDHPLEDVVENLAGDLLWSCNLAVNRSLFDRLSGFDEDFLIAGGEDLEFARRLRMSNARIHFASRAIVFHPVRRLSLVGLVNKVFQMHWHILYRLKIDASHSATFHEVVDLLRITTREIFSSPLDRNVQSIARLTLEWAFLPAWIFYLFVWERRFRKRHFQPLSIIPAKPRRANHTKNLDRNF
jgi:glycosyltransferase involved in cell wall biosynthesis